MDTLLSVRDKWQGNQGSPTDPLPQRSGWAAQKTAHTARGTRAYARRLGSFSSLMGSAGMAG